MTGNPNSYALRNLSFEALIARLRACSRFVISTSCHGPDCGGNSSSSQTRDGIDPPTVRLVYLYILRNVSATLLRRFASKPQRLLDVIDR